MSTWVLGSLLGKANTPTSSESIEFRRRVAAYEKWLRFLYGTIYETPNGKAYAQEKGLYGFVRSIFNPVPRLVQFWQIAIWGGELQKNGGAVKIDGREETKEAIWRLWEDSRFQSTKDIIVLWGTLLGTCGIRVVDDVELERVRIEPVAPWTIVDYEEEAGEITSYVIKENRTVDGNVGEYVEKCYIDGNGIRFETYFDGKPYDVYGWGESWSLPYPFVPFVIVKHIDIGEKFGIGEAWPYETLINEINDQASIFADYVRRNNNPPFLANFAKPNSPITRAFPGNREETPILHVPDRDARVEPMVAKIDIAGVTRFHESLHEKLVSALPELNTDIWRIERDISGSALREVRALIEKRAAMRRATYNMALIRAHQMALAIGGFKHYSGYEHFGIDPRGMDMTRHSIVPRRVFDDDVALAAVREQSMRALQMAVNAGIPLSWALKNVAGYTDADVEQVMSEIGKEISLSFGDNLIGKALRG